MNQPTRTRARALLLAAAGTALSLTPALALAQDAARPAASGAPDPTPYYLGVSQGFTHDSNVYRIPSGPSDFYSSTSLFGGFEQRISRQRVFGRANVSLNRYQDESQLNNTSYDLTAGIDWETIQNISGNLNVGLSRNLSAPAASAGVPSATRNEAQTERIDARARWGGPALLTLEGALGYVRVDYSAPEFVSSESRLETASLGLYYRPGPSVRLGVAGRTERTRTPQALFDPVAGTYQSNTVKGNNLDLLADYEVSALLRTNARLSYTRQTNSGISDANFSGLTGSLGVAWQPTAKIGVQLDASRNAGFDANTFSRYALVQTGTTITATPVAGLYENNRVTNVFGLGLTYAATAKINASANMRYTRARLVTTLTTLAGTASDTTDTQRGFSLGANYAILRSWNLGCSLGHESRDVAGSFAYAYTSNTVGCSTQFTWR